MGDIGGNKKVSRYTLKVKIDRDNHFQGDRDTFQKYHSP